MLALGGAAAGATGEKPTILIFNDRVARQDHAKRPVDYAKYFAEKGCNVICVKVVEDKNRVDKDQQLVEAIDDKGRTGITVTRGAYSPEDVKALLKAYQPQAVLTGGSLGESSELFNNNNSTAMNIGGGMAIADLVHAFNSNIPCLIQTSGRTSTGVQSISARGDRLACYHVISHNAGVQAVYNWFQQQLGRSAAPNAFRR